MTRARDLADGTFANGVDVDGTIKLDGNYPTGTGNVALGDAALDDASLSGASNTAIGSAALSANTSGQENTAVGQLSLTANTTASFNTAVGRTALYSNTTGQLNTSVGQGSLQNNTTASYNTAVGYQAAYSNTTGTPNNAFGRQAMFSNTTGNANCAFGEQALYDNTTGNYNLAIGNLALTNNTTASGTTAVGYRAGYSQNRTGNAFNTFLGMQSGYSVTTGTKNTFVGGVNSGYDVTTGSSNTIIGNYTGNQGGLDIRTSSNHIVLSDGDGNPRLWMNGSGLLHSPPTASSTTGAGANCYVDATSGQFARSTSSLRYKNTINDATHGLTELLALRPVTYKGNNDGDTVFGGLIAEEVHDAGLTEFVAYNDEGQPDALAYGNMVSLCIKAIQEQQEIITALEARIAALESN